MLHVQPCRWLRLSERRAAARLDRLAGNVLALVRDEEGHELRDVLWLLDAPELDVLLDALRLRLADRDALLQHRRVTWDDLSSAAAHHESFLVRTIFASSRSM